VRERKDQFSVSWEETLDEKKERRKGNRELTRSFAPRFKYLAPANNLDLLPINVM